MKTKDLLLDAMKFNVLRYCNSNSYCVDRCFIKDICEEYQAPTSNNLDDWSNEDIKEAYGILKVAEQEEW